MNSNSKMKVFIQSIKANFYVMLILSTVLSAAIDYYNFDKTLKVEWTYSEKAILWHWFGFFVYQILHYFIGLWLINKFPREPFLAVLEGIQTYVVILYFHNSWITEQQKLAERIFELFEYSKISQKYSVYLFILCSTLTAITNWFASGEDAKSSNENDKKEILGTTYGNCTNIMSWLNMFCLFPSLFACGLDLLLMLNGKPSTTKQSGDTNKEVTVLFHSFIFLVYQLLRAFVLQIIENGGEYHASWTQWELVQLVWSLIYLFNPFILELRKEHSHVVNYFEYTSMYEKNIAIPVFLLLMAFKTVVNYEMSRTASYKRTLKNYLDDRNSLKVYGITYTAWAYSIIFIQIVSFTSVPIVFWIERSIFKLSGFNLKMGETFILAQSILLNWYQITRISIFCCFAFSSMYYSFVIFIEIWQLFCFLLYWFNPWLSIYKTLNIYFGTHYPYTSMAQTFSFIICISVSGFIITLMYKMNQSDPEECEKYQVLDGEMKSSTKKEHHEHPAYWLRKQKKEISKLAK